jgi:hypothetical protein
MRQIGNNAVLFVIPEGNLVFLGSFGRKLTLRAAQRLLCGLATGLAGVANNLPKMGTE